MKLVTNSQNHFIEILKDTTMVQEDPQIITFLSPSTQILSWEPYPSSESHLSPWPTSGAFATLHPRNH